MADTGWTCSACGTVNDPGARACAGCGRWPSVFDLESSSSRYRTDRDAADGGREHEIGTGGPEDGGLEAGEPETGAEPDENGRGFRWGPVITLAIAAVFVLVSWLSDKLGG